MFPTSAFGPAVTRLLTRTAFRLALAGACALAAGCTNLLTPLGTDKYDCNRKEDPASPYCHSFRSVVQGTNGPLPDSRYDEVMRLSDYDRLTGIAPPGGAGQAAPADGPERSPSQRSQRAPSGEQPGVMQPVLVPARMETSPGSHRPVIASAPTPASSATQPPAPIPVRVGPLVQRVWIKRYVDDHDMLVSNTYVYKEIVPAHWSGYPTDASTQGTETGAPYPHRPAETPAPAPVDHQAAAQSAPSPNEFAQPGHLAVPANVVPSPTTTNGTSSLPQ
jgi:hypothetical protein